MPVPFYLQKPEDIDTGYSPDLVWNTFEDPNKYYVSKGIADFSAIRGKLNELFDKNMKSIRNAKPAPQQRPSSWKDDINYDNGYDSSIEDKFRAEHDYIGLADYLSKFRMGNQMEQRAYENEIAQIRRYGRQYNAIHSHATNEQTNSISFLEAYDSGNIDGLDNNNPLKQQYNDAVSFLGRDVQDRGIFGEYLEAPEIGDKEAASIDVTFNNKHVSYGLWGYGFDRMSKDTDENQFNKFAQDTGYGLSEIKSILGENAITRSDGKITINVPKTNLEGIKLLTQIRKWCNDTGRTSDDIAYASYGADKNLISDNTVNIGYQIQGVSNFLDKVNKDKNDVIASIGASEQIVSTTVLPYMNERQMQLNGLRKAGLIDDSKYTSMMKADNEVYENLLLGTAFSQLEIFTDKGNEEGNEHLSPMTDNRERGALKNYIRNAIRENRVSWRAAISGGEYGTYLVVSPEDNKGDLVYEDDDARGGMTIFIPGLFTKSIQSAFNSSTQGKTVAEINSMQQYGYEYELQDGNVLSNIGNNMARLYDKNTDSYKDISREEAQNILHKDIIIEDASKSICNRAFNLDGTLRSGYNPETDAKKIAIAAANKLYPGSPVEEYDIDAWNPSKEDAAKRKAQGNVDREYKAYQAYDIYEQLMGSIYKLLNVSR